MSLNCRPIYFGALLLWMGLSNSVEATNYYVRTSGSDSNQGTTASAAFKTLSKASSVATSGDTIYIGAGIYVDKVDLDASKPIMVRSSRGRVTRRTARGPVLIVGDTLGKFTGDKGSIVLQPPEKDGSWIFTLRNGSDAQFSSIIFDSGSPYAKVQGCRIVRLTGTTTFTDCTFQNLSTACSSDDGSRLSISSSRFAMVDVGVYSAKARQFTMAKSSFMDCHVGVDLNTVTASTISGSSFGWTPYKYEKSPTCDGVRVLNSGLTLSGCEFQSLRHGIYGTGFTSMKLSDSTFLEPQLWAVYGTGRGLSIQKSTIDGKGKRAGSGVSLTAKNQEPLLSSVQIHGLDTAIMAVTGDYQYRGVTVSDCNIGVCVNTGNTRMTLDSRDKLDLTKNKIAIYCNQVKGKEARITLQQQTISDNDYGILSYFTNYSISNSKFIGNGVGLYAGNASTFDINNGEFSKHSPRNNVEGYALFVESNSIRVRNTNFFANQNGLCVQNTGTAAATLSTLTFRDNVDTNLRIKGGKWTWNANTRIAIANGKYGVYAEQLNWTISGLKLENGCQYPITDVQGSLRVVSTSMAGGQVGIHSNASKSLSLSRVTIQKAAIDGIQAISPESMVVDRVVSSSNGSGGMICESTSGIDIQVVNSEFSNNGAYGIRLKGVGLRTSNSKNITLTGNKYGLQVENRDFEWLTSMAIRFTNNEFALVGLQNRLTAKGITLTGNGTAIYSSMGGLSLDSCNFTSTDHGILCYPSDKVTISATKVQGSTIGMYFAPISKMTGTVDLHGCEVTGCGKIGIYVGSDKIGILPISVASTEIGKCPYGLYSEGSQLSLTDSTFAQCENSAIVQLAGSTSVTNTQVDGSSDWGLIDGSKSCELRESTFANTRGVYMTSDFAQLVNTVVHRGEYGVFLNNPSGRYEIRNSTLANLSQAGIWHEDGYTTVQNTIVRSSSIGLWNRLGQGVLEHDHNIVRADKENFVNTELGEGEITKDPIFVDEISGDLRLAPGSPAINAGQDLSKISTIDRQGNPRPSFRKYEIGAFEFMESGGSLRVLDWNEVAH